MTKQTFWGGYTQLLLGTYSPGECMEKTGLGRGQDAFVTQDFSFPLSPTVLSNRASEAGDCG